MYLIIIQLTLIQLLLLHLLLIIIHLTIIHHIILLLLWHEIIKLLLHIWLGITELLLVWLLLELLLLLLLLLTILLLHLQIRIIELLLLIKLLLLIIKLLIVLLLHWLLELLLLLVHLELLLLLLLLLIWVGVILGWLSKLRFVSICFLLKLRLKIILWCRWLISCLLSSSHCSSSNSRVHYWLWLLKRLLLFLLRRWSINYIFLWWSYGSSFLSLIC